MTTPTNSSYSTADVWCRRLAKLASDRPVVFIVGSGISQGLDGRGVWNVGKMVKEGQRLLAAERGPAATATGASADAYQRVMDELKDEDPALVDQVVRSAVIARNKLDALQASGEEQRELCAAIEQQSQDWYLPPGVEALADLIAATLKSKKSRVASPSVVTTNFDGLLELALQKRGVSVQRYSVIVDEHPRSTAGEVGVWHVHGYWTDAATLHTQGALGAARPGLCSALKRRLDGAEVCVLGYGGWNDVVFKALAETLRGGFTIAPRVTWPFYEAEAAIASTYRHVLDAFAGSLSGQVRFYCGVDLHKHLPEVVKILRRPAASAEAEPKASESGPAAADESRARALLEELIEKTPLQQRKRLEVFRTVTLLVFCLLDLVAVCCDILETMTDSAQRSAWRPVARKLIGESARAVLEAQAPLAFGAGEVLSVAVRTPLLVEILVARSLEREPSLLPHARGARGEDLVWVDDEAPLPETGPAQADFIAAFEALVWDKLFATSYSQQRDSDVLYGRLDADAARKRRRYALVRPETTARWKQPSAGSSVEAPRILRSVAFIERAEARNETLGLDEFQLAHSIADFLKLSEK